METHSSFHLSRCTCSRSHAASEHPCVWRCASWAADKGLERGGKTEAAIRGPGWQRLSSWESGLHVSPCSATCLLCGLEQVNELSGLFPGVTSGPSTWGCCEDSDLKAQEVLTSTEGGSCYKSTCEERKREEVDEGLEEEGGGCSWCQNQGRAPGRWGAGSHGPAGLWVSLTFQGCHSPCGLSLDCGFLGAMPVHKGIRVCQWPWFWRLRMFAP